jgi:hypothetical protein
MSHFTFFYLLNDDHTVRPVNSANTEDMAKVEAALQDPDGRRVALTDLPGNVLISTVFLVSPRDFDAATPHLFQSKVFGGDWDDREFHWLTWEDAEAGHQMLADLLGTHRPASDADLLNLVTKLQEAEA